MDVARAEGAPLALPQVALLRGVPRPGLLRELALDGEEGALRLEVVVPARGGSDRPVDQPDLEVGGGVEPAPAALGRTEVDLALEVGVGGEQPCCPQQLATGESVDAGCAGGG